MISKTKSVDIVMPMYNAEKYIRNTIKSIIKQSFTNWRLYVVDDCSTDNSFNVVSELAKKDSRIIPIRASTNGGPAKARNIALHRCKSSYVAFLDSDDLWMPKKLTRSLEALLKERAVFVCTAFLRQREDGVVSPFLISPFKSITKSRLAWSNWVYTSTVIINKDISGDFLMNTDVYYDDYLCWWDLLDKGKGYYLDEALTMYVEHKGSVSRNKINSASETWKLKRHYMGFGLLKAIYTSITYIIFGLLKVKGRHVN